MMKTTSLPSCLLTQHTAQSFHFQRQKDMLLQSSSFASPFHAATAAAATTTIIKNYLKDLNPTSALLSKSLFPDLGIGLCLGRRKSPNTKLTSTATRVQSSLLEAPVLWAGRVCIFYALLKSGLAGSPSNPLVADLETGSEDLGFSKWIEELQSKPEKEATDKRKFVSKWHSTTKGTLRRNYRIPSKTEGRHLLRSIASLLSDDDQFRDATSHKGCQIRRESAHGESVCCNNVRALFDELPTPHVVVEITPFPAGPLGEKDYAKAVKLEKVLRSGPSV